jgi:MFS superfamily sulfate permease-like transporter
MSETPAERPGGTWQGGGPPPGYAAGRPRNGTGVAALVVGIVALVLAVLLVFAPLAALLGLIALILGIVGLSQVSRGVADNRGQAVTGLVTGAIALVIGIVLTVTAGTFFATHANDFRRLGDCMSKATNDQARRACAQEFSDRMDR